MNILSSDAESMHHNATLDMTLAYLLISCRSPNRFSTVKGIILDKAVRKPNTQKLNTLSLGFLSGLLNGEEIGCFRLDSGT